MQEAAIFILRTLFDLYVLAFVLRLILQWARVDARNPFCQFILRITNPLVLPLRRYVPAIGRIDTATLLVLLILQGLFTWVLVSINCVTDASFVQLLSIAVLRTLQLILRIYFFAILIHVVLSWVSPGNYSPAAVLVHAIAEPVLAPFRRLLPPIGGLDLSPLFALIALQALTMLLPFNRILEGMICLGAGALLT